MFLERKKIIFLAILSLSSSLNANEYRGEYNSYKAQEEHNIYSDNKDFDLDKYISDVKKYKKDFNNLYDQINDLSPEEYKNLMVEGSEILEELGIDYENAIIAVIDLYREQNELSDEPLNLKEISNKSFKEKALELKEELESSDLEYSLNEVMALLNFKISKDFENLKK